MVSYAPHSVGVTTYFRWKWGIRLSEGSNRNAGNVMRLKTPVTTRKPRRDEAKTPERFYASH